VAKNAPHLLPAQRLDGERAVRLQRPAQPPVVLGAAAHHDTGGTAAGTERVDRVDARLLMLARDLVQPVQQRVSWSDLSQALAWAGRIS
jgi:hypothetical protein